jgi:hypothetical protein
MIFAPFGLDWRKMYQGSFGLMSVSGMLREPGHVGCHICGVTSIKGLSSSNQRPIKLEGKALSINTPLNPQFDFILLPLPNLKHSAQAHQRFKMFKLELKSLIILAAALTSSVLMADAFGPASGGVDFSKHPYKAPGPNDLRGPCPGLNT